MVRCGFISERILYFERCFKIKKFINYEVSNILLLSQKVVHFDYIIHS